MKKYKITASLMLAAFLILTGCSSGGKKGGDTSAIDSSGGGETSVIDSSGEGESSSKEDESSGGESESSGGEEESVAEKAWKAYQSANENLKKYVGSYSLEGKMYEGMEEENAKITVDGETGRFAYHDDKRDRVFVPGEDNLGMFYEAKKSDPEQSYRRAASNSFGVQDNDILNNLGEMTYIFLDVPLYCFNAADTEAVNIVIYEMMVAEYAGEFGLVYDGTICYSEFAEKSEGVYTFDYNYVATFKSPIAEEEYPQASIELALSFEFTEDFLCATDSVYTMTYKMTKSNVMSMSAGEQIKYSKEFNETFYNEQLAKCKNDEFSLEVPLRNEVYVNYNGVSINQYNAEPNEQLTVAKLTENIETALHVTVLGVYNDPELTEPFEESKSTLYYQELYLKLTPKDGYSILITEYNKDKVTSDIEGFTPRAAEIASEMFYFHYSERILTTYTTEYEVSLPWHLVDGGTKIVSATLDGVDYDATNANLAGKDEHLFVINSEREANHTGSHSSPARFEFMGIANDGDGLLVPAFAGQSYYFTVDVKDIQKEGFELKYSDYASNNLLDENGVGGSIMLSNVDVTVNFYDEDENVITELPAEGRILIHVGYDGEVPLHYVLIG